MSWSEERVAILKRMWLEGKSASEIARELGKITRNAVIGKVHRLGLSNREVGSTKSQTSKTHKQKPLKKGRPPKNPTTNKKKNLLGHGQDRGLNLRIGLTNGKVDKTKSSADHLMEPNKDMSEVISDFSEETIKSLIEIERHSKKISLMELTEKTCKWPIGDPATENFWFCGHEAEAGKPYCKTHVSVAFQPVNQRRSKKDG